MTYFWIITFQWIGQNGVNNMTTETGIEDTLTGVTRQRACQVIFEKMCAKNGAPPGRTSVLFFSLEPNIIGESAA